MPVDLKLFDNLDAAAEDAGPRLGRAARPGLFDRIDWFRLIARYTPPDGRLLVMRALHGVVQAWLFLSVAEGNAEALSNWYSIRCGPIVDGALGALPFQALARGLRRAGVSRLFLKPMDDPGPLAAALKRRGWATSISPVDVSWRMDTRGMSFDEYWESRSNNLRRGVERRIRKNPLRSVVYDRFDERAWREYEAVYAASWKPAEGSPEFLRGLAEQEGAAGTLRLGIAYDEGGPVAAELWLVEKGVATIYKSAYREDARHLGPGNILRLALFRRALDEEGLEAIDFGVGDQPYKAEWMSHKVPLYALTAYDLLRPAGLAGIAKSLSAKLVRRVRSR